MSPNIQHKLRNNTLTSMLSYAEHLTEIEVNKLQKYFYQNQILVYYFLVRLGISTSLRYSDLSHIIWEYLLGRDFLAIREQKTNRAREMPLNFELNQIMTSIYVKKDSPERGNLVVYLTPRVVNKQLKIYAAKAGIRGKRISNFRKTFGREVWKRNNFREVSLTRFSSFLGIPVLKLHEFIYHLKKKKWIIFTNCRFCLYSKNYYKETSIFLEFV